MSEKVKSKKIETPIDQRETFVSLSRNFGEGALSVEEKLQVLYSLQETDNEIEKIVNLRGALPQEVAEIEKELDGLKARVDEFKSLISQSDLKIANCKKQIEEYDVEIAKYQAQLTNIANSREFDSISKELENLGLLRDIAQKHINEERMAISGFKADIDDLQGRLAIREEDLAAKRGELDSIVESTAKDEERLLAKREEYSSKLDERTLVAYDRIRNSVHNHLAVVSVYNGDSCGGCFNTITPQRLIEISSGKKLIICENCGRILVNPLAKAE